MDGIDEQTRAHGKKIVVEPIEPYDDTGLWLKKITGNDCCMLRNIYEHEPIITPIFTPIFKPNHLWVENEPYQLKLAEELVGENKIHKSRKTYEIKSNWAENFNKSDKYQGGEKLFNEPTNI